MSLKFQTILSGSSGNLVMVWSDSARVMIDCGARSQRELNEILSNHQDCPPLDAVFVSHLHSDHINYSALKVLEQHNIPVYVHKENRKRLLLKHSRGKAFPDLKIKTFDNENIKYGDLEISAFETCHEDDGKSHGFAVKSGNGTRVTMATDFFDWSDLAHHFADSNLIYVEANHCPSLLNYYPNPNSHFHLSNKKTGMLVAKALAKSRNLPDAIVLGHLSDKRNKPELAKKAVSTMLEKEKRYCDIQLDVAPRYEPSQVYALGNIPQPESANITPENSHVQPDFFAPFE